MNTRLFRTSLLAIACSLSLAVSAQDSARTPIDIPSGDLVSSLQSLTRQSGAELAYREDLLSGLKANAVRGSLTAEQALEKMLEGTGFTSRKDPSGALMIIRRDGPARRTEPQTNAPRASTAAPQPEPPVGELQRLVVTGTRIRGGSTPSPVIVIGSERIQEEGFSDLGEVIRSIPQNFSGGQNPGVLESGGTIANQNLTGGSGLNLRGLGPDATLTLLNGRRLSYSSIFQAVDISAIPVEAVERIEILADGASAIYGSDAVAGVGNVILKRDFEGLRVGARHGGATDGGLRSREYTATAGAMWMSGGLIATYRDQDADPLFASDRDYASSLYGPRSLYPSNALRSGLLSAHQSVGEAVDLQLDVLRTERKSDRYSASAANVTRVPAETRSTLIAPGIDVHLPAEWSLSLGATWGKDDFHTWYETTNRATDAESSALDESYANRTRSIEVSGEGPVFSLGGGEARVAIGAGSRTYEFLGVNHLVGSVSVQGEESNRFAYAELSLPFVGADNRIPGVDRLLLTAALRAEDYDGFDRVSTPKLGVVYGPTPDFTLRASWGRSFKAPTLLQRYQTTLVYNLPVIYGGGSGYPADAAFLMTWGGNPDLKPERAKTWTGTLDFHPRALPGLRAELTWFDIDYADRVVQPIAGYWLAMDNPIYAAHILYAPTAAEVAAVAAIAPVIDQGGQGYNPDNIVAVFFNQYTNAMRQRARGADLSASYRMDIGDSRMTLRGSASWLDTTQQTGASQPEFELSGNIFNPADLSARLGAVWERGGLMASAFVNHTAGISVNGSVDAGPDGKTGSFNTWDATFRYRIGEGEGIFSGIDLTMSAQNLFNRPPPLYGPVNLTATAPYDSLNYSAIGRFLSLSVSKHF
ncbi:TonB-dependent receptor [Luteimonas saliphila]|uniref:TonB-dependent receptor n=1 Tax=Luteimonas saliphila TaxID=2804919 RepID=UPI001EE29EB8|nr:TonB-dependent receptor [Luteimonas saliphila]